MQSILWIVFGAAAYLLGSFPTAYVVARAHGIDIRAVGSGNVGATNVSRALGKWWGLFTFVVDALKGFVPARVFPALASALSGNDGPPEHIGLACAALAIAGHNWPVFLRFKGGKGVATSAGGLLGLAPLVCGVGLAVWIVVFLATRYVSVASMLATVSICVSSWVIYRGQGFLLPAVLTFLGIVLVFRHKSNLARLLQGTENRAEFKKK